MRAVAHTPYTSNEVRIDEKFTPMSHTTENSSATILKIDQLNDTIKV